MTEYIEREATVKLLRSLGSRDYRKEKGTIQEAIKMVSFPEYTPPADVAPVRHGRWDKGHEMMTCTNCCEQFDLYFKNDFNYCPNCGARMDEEVSE